MFQVGQRIDHKRRGKVYTGRVIGIDEGTLCGPYYWVRDQASDIRMAVLPQQVIRPRSVFRTEKPPTW